MQKYLYLNFIATLGLEESPVGRPKGWHYYLSTPATRQPPSQPTAYMEYSKVSKERLIVDLELQRKG